LINDLYTIVFVTFIAVVDEAVVVIFIAVNDEAVVVAVVDEAVLVVAFFVVADEVSDKL